MIFIFAFCFSGLNGRAQTADFAHAPARRKYYTTLTPRAVRLVFGIAVKYEKCWPRPDKIEQHLDCHPPARPAKGPSTNRAGD